MTHHSIVKFAEIMADYIEEPVIVVHVTGAASDFNMAEVFPDMDDDGVNALEKDGWAILTLEHEDVATERFVEMAGQVLACGLPIRARITFCRKDEHPVVWDSETSPEAPVLEDGELVAAG